MPDAIGRFFSSRIATGGGPCRRQARAQRVARLQDEIGLVGRHGRRVGTGDREFVPFGGLDRDAVAEAREDGEAFDEMIAVGAPSGDVEREIDLRRREFDARQDRLLQFQNGQDQSFARRYSPVLGSLTSVPVGAVGGLLLGAAHLGGHALGFLHEGAVADIGDDADQGEKDDLGHAFTPSLKGRRNSSTGSGKEA